MVELLTSNQQQTMETELWEQDLEEKAPRMEVILPLEAMLIFAKYVMRLRETPPSYLVDIILLVLSVLKDANAVQSAEILLVIS